MTRHQCRNKRKVDGATPSCSITVGEFQRKSRRIRHTSKVVSPVYHDAHGNITARDKKPAPKPFSSKVRRRRKVHRRPLCRCTRASTARSQLADFLGSTTAIYAASSVITSPRRQSVQLEASSRVPAHARGVKKQISRMASSPCHQLEARELSFNKSHRQWKSVDIIIRQPGHQASSAHHQKPGRRHRCPKMPSSWRRVRVVKLPAFSSQRSYRYHHESSSLAFGIGV